MTSGVLYLVLVTHPKPHLCFYSVFLVDLILENGMLEPRIPVKTDILLGQR